MTFTVPIDVLVLLGSITGLLTIIKVMYNIAGKNEPVEKKKPKTMFLEKSINELLKNDRLITLKEVNKLEITATGYKTMCKARRRRVMQIKNLVDELDDYLSIKFKSEYTSDGNVKRILNKIK